jgi:hypothetical protein
MITTFPPCEIFMKKQPKRTGPILRWGRALLMAAPLLLSCEKSSKAEVAPVAEAALAPTLVAANSAGDDKGTDKDADMKEVILHVFGMT